MTQLSNQELAEKLSVISSQGMIRPLTFTEQSHLREAASRLTFQDWEKAFMSSSNRLVEVGTELHLIATGNLFQRLFWACFGYLATLKIVEKGWGKHG